MNKKAQFFILSAVIIVAIIASFGTLKNTINTGDVPRKFYYYSQQLDEETGAVVNWALYNGQGSGNIQSFVQQGINSIMNTGQNISVYSCYTSTTRTILTCQNNGTKEIIIYTSNSQISISPNSQAHVNINGLTSIIISSQTQTDWINNTIQIENAAIQANQFYFIFSMENERGTIVTDSSTNTENANKAKDPTPPEP